MKLGKSLVALAFITAALPAVGASVRSSDMSVKVVTRIDTNKPNKYYLGNRAPLLPSPLIKLPAGAIRPEGWLRKQLELEADGFIGHLTEISGFLNKRDNAWLTKDGTGKNGWEEMPYWLRGFSDLGFVLGDKRIITESKLWLDAALASQKPDGWFGPVSNLGNGKGPDMMPNMSMLFAFRSYYEYTGDKHILDVMTNYFKWQLTIPDDKFFSGGWQVPRNGDNLDSVYWLYNQTGDKFLLDLADKLMRTGTRWMGKVTGGHNVDYSQGFRKPAQYYVQCKDPAYLQAAENNYNDMYSIYGQVPGGMFCGDEFARPGHTDPQQAIETCGTVDMMLSEQILLRITGDLKWADRCEDAAFNTLPASFTPDLKGLRYLTSPNQCNSDKRSKSPVLADGGPMQWMNPYEHRCCQHNSGMGWPYFSENLWQATPGNGLAAVMYAPNIVSAKVGDGTKVTITETTKYPFDGRIEFAVSTSKAVQFPLYLRIPAWATGMKVAINGKLVKFEVRPRAYVAISRKWKAGDKLTVDFPMEIKLRTWTKNKDAVSVDRGPLTYSVKIGEDYVKGGGSEKWPAFEIKPTTPWNYGLVLDKDNPAKSFEVVEKPWPASRQPFSLDSPIELKVKAKQIPNWQENYWGLIDALQQSPIKSSMPVETITMIPMGAGRLRVSALPVIGDGPDAREWKAPEEPLSSFVCNFGPYSAMFDEKVPASSNDRKVPVFTWWAWETNGTTQWVKRKFDNPRKVSSVEVYWYDEKGKGDCMSPASWKLFYKENGQWKEVASASSYGTEVDQFNKVTFDPVTTPELKIEAKFKPGRNSGIHEWRIE